MSIKTQLPENPHINSELLRDLDTQTPEAVKFLKELPVPAQHGEDVAWSQLEVSRSLEHGHEGTYIRVSTLPNSSIRTVSMSLHDYSISGRSYGATMVFIDGELISLASDYKNGDYPHNARKDRYSALLPDDDVTHTSASNEELSDVDKIFLTRGVQTIKDGLQKGKTEISFNGQRIRPEKRIEYKIGHQIIEQSSK